MSDAQRPNEFNNSTPVSEEEIQALRAQLATYIANMPDAMMRRLIRTQRACGGTYFLVVLNQQDQVEPLLPQESRLSAASMGMQAPTVQPSPMQPPTMQPPPTRPTYQSYPAQSPLRPLQPRPSPMQPPPRQPTYQQSPLQSPSQSPSAQSPHQHPPPMPRGAMQPQRTFYQQPSGPQTPGPQMAAEQRSQLQHTAGILRRRDSAESMGRSGIPHAAAQTKDFHGNRPFDPHFYAQEVAFQQAQARLPSLSQPGQTSPYANAARNVSSSSQQQPRARRPSLSQSLQMSTNAIAAQFAQARSQAPQQQPYGQASQQRRQSVMSGELSSQDPPTPQRYPQPPPNPPQQQQATGPPLSAADTPMHPPAQLANDGTTQRTHALTEEEEM